MGRYAPLICLGEFMGQAAVELLKFCFGVSPAPRFLLSDYCQLLGNFPHILSSADLSSSDLVGVRDGPDTPATARERPQWLPILPLHWLSQEHFNSKIVAKMRRAIQSPLLTQKWNL